MRTKTTAILFCFFLGGFGGHKFYLGQSGMGVLYLLFCWTGIPAFAAFIELILLIVMDENTFNTRFNAMFAGASAAPAVNQAQNIVVNVPSQASGAAPQVDVVAQIEKLHQLRAQGALTDEEFEQQKQKLLSA